MMKVSPSALFSKKMLLHLANTILSVMQTASKRATSSKSTDKCVNVKRITRDHIENGPDEARIGNAIF